MAITDDTRQRQTPKHAPAKVKMSGGPVATRSIAMGYYEKRVKKITTINLINKKNYSCVSSSLTSK